ncbi:MAG: hypothetical protein NTY80_01390 [candidate division SR1 bacterium]|nr:hypothetical protein [candidate division SR1 bacterium]
MGKSDTRELSKLRVPENIAIQENPIAMDLFDGLNEGREEIKNMIKKTITQPGIGGFIFTTIGFFATVKPKLAHELVQYLKEGEAEKFVYLSYQHIYDALEERKQHLKIEDFGTLSNPGKKQIDDAVVKLRKLESFLVPGNISWMQVPTTPIGLVTKEWAGV